MLVVSDLVSVSVVGVEVWLDRMHIFTAVGFRAIDMCKLGHTIVHLRSVSYEY